MIFFKWCWIQIKPIPISKLQLALLPMCFSTCVRKAVRKGVGAKREEEMKEEGDRGRSKGEKEMVRGGGRWGDGENLHSGHQTRNYLVNNELTTRSTSAPGTSPVSRPHSMAGPSRHFRVTREKSQKQSWFRNIFISWSPGWELEKICYQNVNVNLSNSRV